MIRQSTKCHWALKILLTIAFIVVSTTLLFELYLRSQNYLQVQPANYPCSRSDEVLNHGIKPSCKKFTLAADLKTDRDFEYQTNSYGFRGEEPRDETQKILVIGDSFTEGFGLPSELAFPSQLQEGLIKLGLKNSQVLNGGVISYSTALYKLHYLAQFSRFKPKYVLLNLDLSDFSDDIYFWRIAEYGSDGFPARFPARELFPKWTLAFIYSNRSAVLRFVHQEINQIYAAILRRKNDQHMRDFLSHSKPFIKQEDLDKVDRPECKRIAELVANSILDLRQAVEADGGKLGIHMYPSGQVVKSYPAQYGKSISIVKHWDEGRENYHYFSCRMDERIVPAIKNFASSQGIDFFDSFPDVLAAKDNKTMYYDNDAHWNRYGVHFVTSKLAPKLFVKIKNLL